MGIITDILKELPLNAVLRDKLQELERKYGALEVENAKLKEENQELRDEIQRLKCENENLRAPSSETSPKAPTCPNCSTTGRPFYMSPVPTDFVEFEKATHECSRCKYKTRVE